MSTSFIAFNKATDPVTPDDLRINPAAVLYVEASRPDLVGQTTIHLLGQGSMVHALTESVGSVVSAVGALVGATRHYLATSPEGGASTLYINSANVSYLRPNSPAMPDFWYVRFLDGSEVRIMAPLPPGL